MCLFMCAIAANSNYHYLCLHGTYEATASPVGKLSINTVNTEKCQALTLSPLKLTLYHLTYQPGRGFLVYSFMLSYANRLLHLKHNTDIQVRNILVDRLLSPVIVSSLNPNNSLMLYNNVPFWRFLSAAEKVTGNLAELTGQVAPCDVSSVYGIRRAMGIALPAEPSEPFIDLTTGKHLTGHCVCLFIYLSAIWALKSKLNIINSEFQSELGTSNFMPF